MSQFINEVYGSVQTLDSLESSHPVEIQVSTPAEINEVFDGISYNKGASLIRMLIQTIGESAFQRGLQIYLAEFAYKNTTASDLWSSMSRATAIESSSTGGIVFDIATLMTNWVKETGYPLLSVEEHAAPQGKTACRCFAVAQQKFLQSGQPETSDQSAGDSNSALVETGRVTWSVPMAIGAYSMSAATTIAVSQRILDKLSGLIGIDDPTPEGAIFSFNHASTGFYRVLYTPQHFSQLSTLVAKRVLPTLDRLSLLRDCFSLSTCGQGYSVADLLDLIRVFQGETEFTVIQFLSIVLGNLCALHGDQSYAPTLHRLVRDIFGPRWAQLGWGPAGSNAKRAAEHHLTFLERSILVSMLGLYSGDDAIAAEAWARLQAYAADPAANAIQPDLRAPIYSLAIRYAGAAAREVLKSLYLASTSSEERVRLLTALGTTRVPPSESTEEEVTQLLEWIFNSGHVRNGDLIYALTTIGQDSKLSRTICWEYMKKNWDNLLVRFNAAEGAWAHIDFPSLHPLTFFFSLLSSLFPPSSSSPVSLQWCHVRSGSHLPFDPR